MNILFPYMARWKAVNWTRYHQILTRLAEKGHNIFVLQTPKSSIDETNFNDIEVELPATLHLEEVPVSKNLWDREIPFEKLIKKGYYSLVSKKIIKKYIEEKNIDVLLLYNIPQYPFLKFENVISIFDFADDYLAMLKYELGKFSNPLFTGIAQFVLHRMIKKTDICLAVSQVLADQYDGYPIRVLPNGVDLKNYQVGIGKHIKQKYNKYIIGFIGSFEYFIDFDLIIETAKFFPDYLFLMVGGGRRFNEVKNKVDREGLKNFVFTGGLSHAEVMEHIDAMDICLNTFTKDPISHGACPIKLFEYMAMEKPVISTRIIEVEYIDNGAVYFADTADEMHKNILQIINNHDETKNHIKLGKQLVVEKYNWDQITNQFIDIIKEKI